MAFSKVPNLQSTNHIPILTVLSALIAGNIPAYEALDQLTMLNAESWLIASVRKIEAMYAPADPDYLGPLDEVVRKIQGAS